MSVETLFWLTVGALAIVVLFEWDWEAMTRWLCRLGLHRWGYWQLPVVGRNYRVCHRCGAGDSKEAT